MATGSSIQYVGTSPASAMEPAKRAMPPMSTRWAPTRSTRKPESVWPMPEAAKNTLIVSPSAT